MAYATFRLLGPNIKLAGEQFRRTLERIIRQMAHALRAELVRLSPGSGNLRDAWSTRLIHRQKRPVGLVINTYRTESGYPIMLLLEHGTGIYGPHKKLIKPINAKALHWIEMGEGGEEIHIFRAWVRGIDPKKHAFVDKAIKAARPEFESIIHKETRGWYRQGPINEIS